MTRPPKTDRRTGVRHAKRQLNSTLSPEVFARIARAARKANMTRSAYQSEFVTMNIDVIDPEGAATAPEGDQP
jgi:hypothetical protein